MPERHYVSEQTLKNVMYMLENAIVYCANAESYDHKNDNHEQSYAYACGWSRSAMQRALKELERVQRDRD